MAQGSPDQMSCGPTSPHGGAPPLTVPTYIPPDAHNKFLEYRRAIAHQDLPLLSSAAQQQGAQVIAKGLATLVEEQRLARQEAADQCRQRDARKSPSDFYGVLLERLMRGWAQVSDKLHLPQIHEELGNNKKSRLRGILQTAVEECLFTNDFVEDLPVSTTLDRQDPEVELALSVARRLHLRHQPLCGGLTRRGRRRTPEATKPAGRLACVV